jgi:hypothetical protein
VTPELADRLAKLLRLLCGGGPNGEVLAAANRISALVVANNLDWDAALAGNPTLTREQLSEVYEAGLKAGIESERNAKANGDDWAKTGRSRADEIGDRADELRQILNAAAQAKADGLLDGWFGDFAPGMRERLDRWGNRMFVTERQWECVEKLRSILERQDYL